MTPCRVVIADDHPLFLNGLRLVLDTSSQFEVVAEAGDGHGVMEFLAHHPADIAVLDISMPNMDGTATAKAIKQRYPTMRVLMLTMYRQDALIKKLMRAGVNGYILKENGQKELLVALEAIAAGQKYFDPEVTQAVMESFNPLVEKTGLDKVHLTKREMEVLQLVAQELTTQEIADRIFVSQNTVITHRKNIMRKLDVRNAAGMVRLATEMGLID